MQYLLLAILLVVVIAAVLYNKLVRLRTGVDESWYSMDIFLKKRYDLIPNLVETAKGYATHESLTFERIVAARNQAVNAQNRSDITTSNADLDASMKGLFALAEQYPDLKANTQFTNLSESLNKTEADIANARLYYNGNVKRFNQAIQEFPTVFIANVLHYQNAPYYAVTEAERESVQVKF